MKMGDIYPRLAVWVRGHARVWAAIVLRKETYRGKTVYSDGVLVVGELEEESLDFVLGPMFCYARELEPRNPNNLNEIPPEPLGEVDESLTYTNPGD